MSPSEEDVYDVYVTQQTAVGQQMGWETISLRGDMCSAQLKSSHSCSLYYIFGGKIKSSELITALVLE